MELADEMPIAFSGVDEVEEEVEQEVEEEVEEEIEEQEEEGSRGGDGELEEGGGEEGGGGGAESPGRGIEMVDSAGEEIKQLDSSSSSSGLVAKPKGFL
ncbi:putative heterogeneous nuclear ribonucleoprotein 1 [Cocos nucifera]|uniref:Putative heterogeneous nuclear ribonucleoprotein 1 n=1 Tax=Cocos nucifera TaxID=13894 RepID=A0A8K0HXP3_COCNU|nr:putative heterogeneous nuclear ribonucleoprotein 1 [Cocos nucifera]